MRLILVSLFLLAGCATQHPVVKVIKEPVEVKVLVPVTCVIADVAKPNWAMDNIDPQHADIFVLGLAALQELEQRRSYEAELEAIIAGCKKVP
jgi:hypothetical protein